MGHKMRTRNFASAFDLAAITALFYLVSCQRCASRIQAPDWRDGALSAFPALQCGKSRQDQILTLALVQCGAVGELLGATVERPGLDQL